MTREHGAGICILAILTTSMIMVRGDTPIACAEEYMLCQRGGSVPAIVASLVVRERAVAGHVSRRALWQ
jgi:hypothetical protein